VINWDAIDYDSILILAHIAASYSLGISDLLKSLNLLDPDERTIVEKITQQYAESSPVGRQTRYNGRQETFVQPDERT